MGGQTSKPEAALNAQNTPKNVIKTQTTPKPISMSEMIQNEIAWLSSIADTAVSPILNKHRLEAIAELKDTCKVDTDDEKKVALPVILPSVKEGEQPVKEQYPDPSTKSFYGPWVSKIKKEIPAQAVKRLPTGELVFLLHSPKDNYTKMVSESGVDKFYIGPMDLFDAANWDLYSSAKGNYKLKDTEGLPITKLEKPSKEPVRVGEHLFNVPPGYLIGTVAVVNIHEKLVVIKIPNVSNEHYRKVCADYTCKYADKYPSINMVKKDSYVAVKFDNKENYKGGKDKVAITFKSAWKFIVKPGVEIVDSAASSLAGSRAGSRSPSPSPGEREPLVEAIPVSKNAKEETFYYGKVMRITQTRLTIEDWRDDEKLFNCNPSVISPSATCVRDDKVFFKKNDNGEITYVMNSPLVDRVTDGFIAETQFQMEENEEVECKSLTGCVLPGGVWKDGKRSYNQMFMDYLEKYITGFLNGRGGDLYIGIDDNGIIKGTLVEEDRRKQQDTIRIAIDYVCREKISPQVEPEFITISFINLYDPMFDGFMLSKKKMVIKISVKPSGKRILYATTKDDIRYIRQSGSTVRMTNEMINARFSI